MTSLEALNWHENNVEASDETILAQRSKFALVEKRPTPLPMTGDEITDFLNEYEVAVTWKPRSSETVRVVTLTSDAFPTIKGQTLKEAVGRAAAWIEEENE